MNLSVIGCGYLGAVHAASMAQLGHNVVGIDVDPEKVAFLASGRSPFYEPGFEEILRPAVESGRLRFSTDYADVKGAEVHFVGVGTPQLEGSGGADLSYLDSAMEALLPYLEHGNVVVGKSTVPVGTAARLRSLLEASAPGVGLVWNPEFLREGFAVQDTIRPDRVVYGLPGSGEDGKLTQILDEVYADLLDAGVPRLLMDYPTSELVKVSANAFLATKISFINAVAAVADASGADVTKIAEAIGYDDRIGRKFLRAGVGFGGGCLPKDLRAFRARGEELGVHEETAMFREVERINLGQRKRVAKLVREAVGGDLSGKRVAVLGLAFKPNTDDVRDSPALAVATRLKGLGAEVVAADPRAVRNARAASPQLEYAKDAFEAVEQADAVVLLTGWPEFCVLDPEEVGRLARERIVIDACNALDPDTWRASGWKYLGVGR